MPKWRAAPSGVTAWAVTTSEFPMSWTHPRHGHTRWLLLTAASSLVPVAALAVVLRVAVLVIVRGDGLIRHSLRC